MSGIRPSYYGIFEDNDPSKRLMVVANYDNDVPEYWEWSGQGLFPFDASNEAYKLGVNYVLYGLTHSRRENLGIHGRHRHRPGRQEHLGMRPVRRELLCRIGPGPDSQIRSVRQAGHETSGPAR